MRQGEDLEAAGVGEDGTVPFHETVDAAHALEDFRARAQEKVIGIGKEDLGARFFERFRQLRLHRRLRAHGHEEGRAHLVVQRPEDGRPRPGAVRHCFKPEIQAGGNHVAASSGTDSAAI